MPKGVYTRTQLHIDICRKAGFASQNSELKKMQNVSKWELRECFNCKNKFNIRKIDKQKYCSLLCANKCPIRIEKVTQSLYGGSRHNQRHTEETKLRLSIIQKGKHISPETEFKRTNGIGCYKKIAIENGAIPICKQCGKEGNFGRMIHIHHIDKNRRNNKPDNLIVLCVTCHNRVHRKVKK